DMNVAMCYLLELLCVTLCSHDNAVVHWNRRFWTYHFHCLGRLFERHHIRAAYWQKGQVSLEPLHLRNRIGVSRVVDADAFHPDNVADLTVFFWMKYFSGLSELVKVVCRNSLDRNAFEGNLVSGMHVLYPAKFQL